MQCVIPLQAHILPDCVEPNTYTINKYITYSSDCSGKDSLLRRINPVTLHY